MTRLARFKQLIERLLPTASSRTARWYVARRTPTVAELIATSAQLSVGQPHVIQSVIGAGKTSEMLQARRLITEATPDAVTAWVDPTTSEEPFLDMQPGWLVAWVMHALAEELSSRGRMAAVFDRGIVEQLLIAPSTRARVSLPIRQDVALQRLAAALPDGATVFVDSVDRCERHGALVDALRSDLPLLSAMKIGVTLPLPTHVQVTEESLRSALHTAQQHTIESADVTNDEERKWLFSILTQRDSDQLLEPAAVERIVEASGGIARFLVELARSSTQIAFLDGAGTVNRSHVERAVEACVQSLLWDLTPQDKTALRALAAHPNAVSFGDRWWDHIATGRVLWRPRSKAPAQLHPMLATFLLENAA